MPRSKTTLAKASADDFAHCDPPYAPATPNAFDKYTADGFGLAEHTRLRDVALDAGRRDVRMLISNSDTPLVRKLYAGPQFRVIPVHAPRSLAANPNRRGTVSELLIANY
jgi:DNA adenine methylase